MEDTPVVTRRDRLRTATMEEIIATARRLLVEQGPEAASLRAIAREMGMTAPGLYRYYSNREELLRHVIAQMFRELARDIQRAIQEAVPWDRPADAADGQLQMARKMVAACREFRSWALATRTSSPCCSAFRYQDSTTGGSTSRSSARSSSPGSSTPCSSSCGKRSGRPSRPHQRSTGAARATQQVSRHIAHRCPRWRDFGISPVFGATDARCRWRCSAIWASPSTTRPRCSNSPSAI